MTRADNITGHATVDMFATFGTMEDVIRQSQFCKGVVVALRQLPGQCGLESHGALIGEECNRFETMVVEARTP